MVGRKNILIMKNRTEKIRMLNSVFNEGNQESLKSLSRATYPNVLIYEPQHGEGLFFNGRLNSTLPAKYQDKVLTDAEANTMFSKNGSLTVFLLPNNFRD